MTTPKNPYPDVDQNPHFPDVEKEILKFWQNERIFERSVEQRPKVIRHSAQREAMEQNPDPARLRQQDDNVNNEFVFYDGPPFANGLPHYGHLLTGYVKDAIARYQTMRGKRVERRFGWDCHGLPAEMGSEKELGISGRAAIQNFGIDKFNEHCRTSVMKYTAEWEAYVSRQARWVDFKNDYKTMDRNFMESVLWAFKQLYDKGLVYEAYRVMPYSWAAETPLSNFETKLDNSYREREDKAITVAFELNEAPKGAPKVDKYYVLAWTTTPWTLPSNLALAVGKDVEYICHPGAGRDPRQSACYIFAKSALPRYAKELGIEQEKDVDPGLRRDDTIRVENLIGLTYKPLFPYFKDHKNAFRILDGSSFVTDGDGTGIVHMAPGFGEDDQKCCEANGIEVVVPVDGQGKFTDAIHDIVARDTWNVEREEPHATTLPRTTIATLSLRGLNVIAQTEGQCEAEPYKPEQLKKYGLANLRIINWLKMTGHLIKQEDFKHNYPHCWRTDQPLIYRAMPSWYVEVTKFRDRAVEVNKTINWIPEHIRDGQMAHMLATAPDWSISRNRFWGTPIPVWRKMSDVGDQGSEIKVFGSIAEIKDFFSDTCHPTSDTFDLHRPFIDTLTTAKDGSKWKRVEDVFDCWFESGSMPFAQVHYPFENKEWFETHFPADFITEYVGQTRGWFNTLIMLSTALFDKAPFKNCICHGVVLDSETGNKYSKRLKNYKDPMEVMDKYGADALRWLMLASPVMRGADLSVDPDGKFIRDVVRLAIKPIWNAYNFFCMYANADAIVVRDAWNVEREEAHAATSPRTTIVTNIMDLYILAKCAHAVEQIKISLDAYDTPGACDAVTQFFEVLNNWYIRRSKERFWKEERSADKQAAYDTLYTVLITMCQAAAPLLPLTLDAVYKGLTGKESVHLANFPSVIPAKAGIHTTDLDPGLRRGDEELIAQMDWVQDVCNAALGIRNKLNIRVRQPLGNMQVIGKNNISEELLDIVLSEVNVKRCTSLPDPYMIGQYATLKLSINSAMLGKRLPEKMKQILPASKKGEWKQEGGTVEIAGEKLLPAEYTLQLEPKPEYANRAQALSTNDALVILDTTITPELEAEGLARDLVRMVQQARKDAGLHITDRIHLAIVAGGKTAQAVAAHKEDIAKQTLATTIEQTEFTDSTYSSTGEVEGATINIFLKKLG